MSTEELAKMMLDIRRLREETLAAMVGLNDQDLDQKPPDGSWSIRETLAHITKTERRCLQAIQHTRLGES